jgi:hypothetical protein
MFKALKNLFRNLPATLEEALWDYVHRGLASDAKLIEGALHVSGYSPQGSWSRMRIECEISCFRLVLGASVASSNNLDVARRLASDGQERLRAWLMTERADVVSIFATFSQLTITAAIDRLLNRTGYYAKVGEVLASPDLADVAMHRTIVQAFWTGGALSYSGSQNGSIDEPSNSHVRQFLAEYVAVQVNLATKIRSALSHAA